MLFCLHFTSVIYWELMYSFHNAISQFGYNSRVNCLVSLIFVTGNSVFNGLTYFNMARSLDRDVKTICDC